MTNAVTPESAVSDLLGRKVWGAQVGEGGLLEFEFGEPDPADPERGEYHLQIYRSSWRIEFGNELGAGEEDSEDRIRAAVERLNGCILTAIDFQRPSLSTIFRFGDSRLITFEIYTDPSEENAEQWLLYRPDDLLLAIGPGSTWRLIPPDQP